MRIIAQLRFAGFLVFLLVSQAFAGPYIPAGDLALRHDIQQLADYGVLQGPTTTWPLAWGPILADLATADVSQLSPAIANSVIRLQQRASWETRSDELTFNAKAGVAEKPTRIRGFQNTPRGNIDVSAGAGWLGNWFSAEINVQVVDSNQDSKEVRFDNSFVGGVIGNWSVGASTQERWWGPSWDGSLILSNNARPIPSLIVDRIFTDPFETKWLSWLGPWDFSLMFGQMEKDRAVPNAQFFGMRVTVRPLKSLELGLSRTAQWCGDGRPCGIDTFSDLFLGKDNIGDAGIGAENEPGNQMAGIDFRWSPFFFGVPIAAYGQFIGEDEAGGLPSRYLVLLGIDGSGYVLNKWSYRWFAELAGTSCDFVTDDIFNCAYRQGIYQSGYTYRSRGVGHGADNDARIISSGIFLVNDDDSQWRALLRVGELNRGGSVDPFHTLTPTPQDVVSVDFSHSRVFSFGVIDVGVGYEKIDDGVSGISARENRLYIQWRSSY